MVASEAQLIVKYFGRALSAASRAGAQHQVTGKSTNAIQRVSAASSSHAQRTDDVIARPELEFLRMLKAMERDSDSAARRQDLNPQYHRNQEAPKPQQMRM